MFEEYYRLKKKKSNTFPFTRPASALRACQGRWRGKQVGQVMSVCLQSQQPPPPSHHLSKPKGDATLKMRASVRVTRYLESWGAARPFAHLNHRESVSSSETPVPNGRRQKVGPWVRMLLRRGREQRPSPSLAPLAALWVVSAKPFFWTGEAIWRMLPWGLAYSRLSWLFSSPVVDEGPCSGSDYFFPFPTFRPFLCVDTVPLTGRYTAVPAHCSPSGAGPGSS